MALCISLIASKGGVGKTTLAACLSAHSAAGGFKTAIVDLDPQRSLAQWWRLRKNPDNPRLFLDPRDFSHDIQLLRAKGWQRIFIDTPPGDMDIVRNALRVTDFAIIPTRVSALDVMAVEPATDACEIARVPFGFALSAYDPKWKISQTAAPFLRKRGTLLEPPIQYRAAYAATMTVGLTGPESEDTKAAKACRDEISALWRAIYGAAP